MNHVLLLKCANYIQMSNETKLFEALKKASAPAFSKDTLAIHYGDDAWINKQKMLEDLKDLKERILTFHDLYVVDQLIEKIEKL